MTPEQKLKYLIEKREEIILRVRRRGDTKRSDKSDYFKLSEEIVQLQREVSANRPKTA